ncbi:MAG: glycosyltransferase family 4 protein [Martelella sp.]|uniref:glycosyltransferase family 4 protein n=1 Tax=Martelella sp. TaxID=1969699 RepID=UPI0032421A72
MKQDLKDGGLARDATAGHRTKTARGSGDRPLRVLMTVDAVGGLWRYAMALGEQLQKSGFELCFAGFGPAPMSEQIIEAERIGRLRWLDAPLDWMVSDVHELNLVPKAIAAACDDFGADIVQVNLPSQAAGLEVDVPVVAVSHSCLPTWFDAMRPGEDSDRLAWHRRLNRTGFDNADAVVAPSGSHAAALFRSYGEIVVLEIVHNGVCSSPGSMAKQNFVFAAGRWWDEAKNARTLDEAARNIWWPVVMAGSTRGPDGSEARIVHAISRGALPYGETMALMAQAAIFASPSLYEPFGLAALEAASSGAALVLADIPTYRELWDGVAVFADPHEPKAFAHAISHLAGDPRRRHDLARRATSRSARFAPQLQASAMAALYRELVNTAKVGRTVR